jgi:hypothetical protein
MVCGYVSSYGGAYEVFVEKYEKEQAEYVEERLPKRLADRALENSRRAAIEDKADAPTSFYSDEKDGLKRWQAFLWLLKNLSWKLHEFQRKFFTHAIAPAVAQSIIGPDWPTYGPGLSEKHGWNHIVKRAIGSGPRREGKSVVVSVVIAALALVTRCVICVFSTGRRASDGLRDYVINNYRNSGRTDRIASRGLTSETIHIFTGIHGKTGEMSTLRFFPAAEKIAKLQLHPHEHHTIAACLLALLHFVVVVLSSFDGMFICFRYQVTRDPLHHPPTRGSVPTRNFGTFRFITK